MNKLKLSVVSFALFAFPAFAQAEDSTFLVLLNQNPSAIKNFSNSVESAGGSVKFVIEEIGVGFATSSDPKFMTKLSRRAGIQGVAYSLPVLMEEDQHTALGPQANLNHAGEDEFFYPIQWGLDVVGAPAAWDAGATGKGVRVAVLDSGIDHDNLDLAPNLNEDLSISFMPCVFGENCDGDVEDWRVDDRGGVPFFNHGTHVAGTIAAADGGGGGIGVAPDAEIVAVKVCTEFDSFCFDEAILPGIVYAASIGADLINMSLGGVGDRNPSGLCKFIRDEGIGIPCGRIVSSFQTIEQAYRRACHYANRNGTTVILSAGNSALDADHDVDADGNSLSSLKFYFADFPNVLGISALGPVGSALPAFTGLAPAEPVAGPDTLAYYSNYGRSIIDFGAPGGNALLAFLVDDFAGTLCFKNGFVSRCYLFDMVLSNAPNDYFFYAQGTSMAAPHATGVAAIIVGMNGGDMSPQRLRTAMKRYADDLGQPGHDQVFGDGRVSAGNAVK